jgi:hypothetical protein
MMLFPLTPIKEERPFGVPLQKTMLWERSVDDEFDGQERRRAPLEGIVDRRQYLRFAVEAWAEVMVKDGTMLFRGRVLDLSVAGCYIETEARLRLIPGTPVEMVFRLNDKTFRCEALSCKLHGNGAGFLFRAMNRRTREELDNLIAQLEQ